MRTPTRANTAPCRNVPYENPPGYFHQPRSWAVGFGKKVTSCFLLQNAFRYWNKLLKVVWAVVQIEFVQLNGSLSDWSVILIHCRRKVSTLFPKVYKIYSPAPAAACHLRFKTLLQSEESGRNPAKLKLQFRSKLWSNMVLLMALANWYLYWTVRNKFCRGRGAKFRG